ncbi:MAG: hypothetical protein IPN14_08575 [Bacteroidetes bacterium]|nr:hypothetical protein [Bacteroidota bacterium]
MSNTELQNNFCAFVCRDRIPNLTSRTLFARISSAIGTANTYCIPANHRTTRGGPTLFSPFTSFKKQIVLFNSQYNSNRNISGLAVSVKTKVGSIILTGDAHYEQISRDILSTLNYTHKHNLVVPHHGGKAGTYKYSIPKLATVGQAIISVGKNGYGHPLTHYISALKASGFIVQLTQISINDIIITL